MTNWQLKQLIKEEVQAILKESPDTINIPRDHMSLDWFDEDTIAFGYWKDKLFLGYSTHGGMPNYQRSLIAASADLNIPLNDFIVRAEFAENKSLTRSGNSIGRYEYKYPGRLWLNSNIISFWKYPNSLSELNKVIRDIKKEYNICKKIIPPKVNVVFNIKYVDIPKDVANADYVKGWDSEFSSPVSHNILSSEYSKYISKIK